MGCNMWDSSLCERFSAQSAILLPAFVDAAIKGMAILVLTAAAALAMRRASAAGRHLVWFLGMLGLLIVPIFSAALPGWHVLPRWANHNSLAVQPTPVASPAPAIVPAATECCAEPPTSRRRQRSRRTAGAGISPRRFRAAHVAPTASGAAAGSRTRAVCDCHWQAWVLLAWLAGSRVALGVCSPGFREPLVVAAAISPASREGNWPVLLGQLCDQLGFRRPVELLAQSAANHADDLGAFAHAAAAAGRLRRLDDRAMPRGPVA